MFRNKNIIAVVDVRTNQVVWRLKEKSLDFPHQPTMHNGNILIFDNGAHRSYSRIIGLNPFTKKIVWEYTGSSKESFFQTQPIAYPPQDWSL